jgi:predicted RecA/RadA family phage recombinase
MSAIKEAIEKQKGSVLDITLTGDVNVGDVTPLGTSMISIACSSGLTGEVIAVETEKVWTLNAKTADVIGIGDTLYFDVTNRELTITDTSNIKAGIAVSAKGATAGTIDIKINIG